jgi:hypothetical protein
MDSTAEDRLARCVDDLALVLPIIAGPMEGTLKGSVRIRGLLPRLHAISCRRRSSMLRWEGTGQAWPPRANPIGFAEASGDRHYADMVTTGQTMAPLSAPARPQRAAAERSLTILAVVRRRSGDRGR